MKWNLTGFSIVMILSLSCSRDSCPLSSGTSSTDTRDLPSFNTIMLYDKINLILTPDSVQLVKVEGGKNLLQGISTTVSEGTLTIQDHNGCKLLRTDANVVNVYISTGQLQKILYYGAGNVSSTDTLRASAFTVDCTDGAGSINLKLVADSANAIIRTGNADISFNGHGSYAYIYSEDEGSANLFQYKAQSVVIETKSIRDIDVNVTANLVAHILYIGNVYYTGNPPSIQTQISSSGRLILEPQ